MAIPRRLSHALKAHRIPLAVAVSLLLHAALMSGAYVAATYDPVATAAVEPDEPGAVELLPVEMAGVGEAEPSNEPDRQQPASEAQATAAAEPVPAGPPADTGEVPPPSETAAAEPGPAQQDAPEPAADTAAAPKAAEPGPSSLTVSLGGTDSLSNAIVQGDAIIPARPDDQYRNRPPLYPKEALRHGQGGAVLVVIHVSASGAAAGADILESSGYPLLDRAALDAVQTWRFRPAMAGGRTVAFDMPMRFVFELDPRGGR